MKGEKKEARIRPSNPNNWSQGNDFKWEYDLHESRNRICPLLTGWLPDLISSSNSEKKKKSPFTWLERKFDRRLKMKV